MRSAAVGLRVASAVAPKALPNLLVGGVTPALLFLAGRRAYGLVGAVLVTARWSCSWQAMRWFQFRKELSQLIGSGRAGPEFAI